MERKKCLIISVSGIGNTIMQSPLIKEVALSDRYIVDCLFGNTGMASVFKGFYKINNSYILPFKKREYFNLLLKLFHVSYDITIACFPSNRPQFHLLPFLIGAKERIINSYGKNACSFSFLSNRRQEAIRGIHDVEQNLCLLNALGIPFSLRSSNGKVGEMTPFFLLSQEDRIFARDFLTSHNIGCNSDKRGGRDLKILGLHAGAGPIRGKRWGIERFSEVTCRLLREGVFDHALIFGGGDERDDKKRLSQLIGGQATVVSADINKTGALIEECSLFLSNDTGLMHIASALGKKTLGIFGPTDWVRTAPYGENACIITPDTEKFPCAPCLKYPFEDVRPQLGCSSSFPCLESITVDMVYKRVLSIVE